MNLRGGRAPGAFQCAVFKFTFCYYARRLHLSPRCLSSARSPIEPGHPLVRLLAAVCIWNKICKSFLFIYSFVGWKQYSFAFSFEAFSTPLYIAWSAHNQFSYIWGSSSWVECQGAHIQCERQRTNTFFAIVHCQLTDKRTLGIAHRASVFHTGNDIEASPFSAARFPCKQKTDKKMMSDWRTGCSSMGCQGPNVADGSYFITRGNKNADNKRTRRSLCLFQGPNINERPLFQGLRQWPSYVWIWIGPTLLN